MLIDQLYQQKNTHSKSIAILIDPDNVDLDNLSSLIHKAIQNDVDYFFVGGSLITGNQMKKVIQKIKQETQIPVIIFPGNSLHIENSADGILLLSLISGRNPEFLIGQHVISAPILKQSGLEILSTGYILVDSGRQTTVSYISNTTPIPHDKPAVAACTALAGEQLGLKLIYLDGGSGAINPVSAEMILAVKKTVDCPVIVGGGINTVQKAKNALEAGADIIVIGNGIEKDPSLLEKIAIEIGQFKKMKA
ncbi:MAG: geranylgeranylglyceryl/heptaprenylglyceryl phosphate synthase [Pseudarcicella sp.]|jgi:putative glycerol-1-phosphate prenyltransferase|nr:geranylgeranylglyceryl/heptaprenylglyceryl phosphate synthase [Pseudarcicella sp.]MBP6409622.1 geranylgeranylglyceryl/heptaprenylglyceryl phosphate synthase [Pseudarcicella sp.]